MTPNSESSIRTFVGPAAFWTLVAAIRVGTLLAFWPGLSTDPDAYVALAESWRRSGTYGLVDDSGEVRPTAFRPPAYPALLAATSPGDEVDPRQVAAPHLLLGLGTVLGTLVWGSVSGSTTAARLAALGVAVDPILLHQSAQPMTETPATFLAVWAVAGLAWGAKRSRPVGFLLAGFALGAACLTRPTFLPVFVLWAGYLAVLAIRGSGKRTEPADESPKAVSMRSLLLFAIPVVALVGLWTTRNQATLGAPVVATTHGGYTVLLGNNDDFHRWLKDPAGEPVWKADRLQAELESERPAGESEVEADRRLQRRARIWIAEHPAAFFECGVYRVGRFWSPTPASEGVGQGPRSRLVRFAIGSWYVAAYALAALGLFASRRRLASIDFSPALLAVFAFVAVHAVYWTDVRMRAPIMPVVYVLAAIGVVACLSYVPRRRNRSSPD